MRDQRATVRLLTERWCGPGENLAFIIGGPQKSGWFGATVGNESHAPHGAGDDRVQPPWPQVNPQVAVGDYVADEWVHDPAVFGWAHAGGSQQSAPQSVAALNNGGHFAWLVCTNQRLAVVVEADALSELERSGERPGLLGGWLGKGKANAGEAEPIETWWQLPINGIGEFTSAALGRGFEPIEFFRINFTDRSTLEFRLKDAAELVKIAGQRI